MLNNATRVCIPVARLLQFGRYLILIFALIDYTSAVENQMAVGMSDRPYQLDTRADMKVCCVTTSLVGLVCGGYVYIYICVSPCVHVHKYILVYVCGKLYVCVS